VETEAAGGETIEEGGAKEVVDDTKTETEMSCPRCRERTG